jgi:predicted aspartyl protease
MGRIVVKVTVANPADKSKSRVFDALVDTGASLLTLPKAWKDDFGKLSETRFAQAELADKNLKEIEIAGPVSIQIEGFPKIFSEVSFIDMNVSSGSYEPLLGYIPLEQAGILVDMLGHRLKAAKSLDLKQSA